MVQTKKLDKYEQQQQGQSVSYLTLQRPAQRHSSSRNRAALQSDKGMCACLCLYTLWHLQRLCCYSSIQNATIAKPFGQKQHSLTVTYKQTLLLTAHFPHTQVVSVMQKAVLGFVSRHWNCSSLSGQKYCAQAAENTTGVLCYVQF